MLRPHVRNPIRFHFHSCREPQELWKHELICFSRWFLTVLPCHSWHLYVEPRLPINTLGHTVGDRRRLNAIDLAMMWLRIGRIHGYCQIPKSIHMVLDNLQWANKLRAGLEDTYCGIAAI
jgi:hypothetical protein